MISTRISEAGLKMLSQIALSFPHKNLKCSTTELLRYDSVSNSRGTRLAKNTCKGPHTLGEVLLQNMLLHVGWPTFLEKQLPAELPLTPNGIKPSVFSMAYVLTIIAVKASRLVNHSSIVPANFGRGTLPRSTVHINHWILLRNHVVGTPKQNPIPCILLPINCNTANPIVTVH